MVTIKGKELVRHERQTKQESINQLIDFGKRHAFTIFVIVAGLVTILVLSAPGESLSTYDDKLQFIVGLYNVAIMAWPLYLAVTTRQQMKLRLVLIGASIVFAFFALAFWVRLIELINMASTAWSIPFVGSIVLPILAVAANGYAAILLSYVPANDTTSNSVELDELDEDLRSAQRKEVRTAREDDAAQTILTQDSELLDEREQELNRLVRHEERTKKAILELPQTYDKMQLEDDLRILNDSIALQKQTRDELKHQHKDWKQAQTQLDGLVDTKEDTEAKIKALTAEIKATAEYAATVASRVPLQEASKRTREAYKARQLSQTRADQTSGKLRQATEERTTLEAERQAIIDKNVAVQSEQRRNWRDATVGPVACLVIALILYPVWYGWVSATA